MNKPPVTIIIVSYNSFATLQRCMDDLLKTAALDIIVIDNASADGSAENIRRHYPAVKLFAETSNHGYGRAANIGFRNVETPYALLLNPDIMATEADVRRLLATMMTLDERTAILAPATTEKDFRQQGLEQRPWVIGAALLLNMRALEQTGLFDENIFLYYEETDLCRRLQAQGYGICIDTDHFLHHLFSGSSTPSAKTEMLKNWHLGWSSMYYHHKHGLARGKNASWRAILRHGKRALLARDPIRRIAYRARVQGGVAYLRGRTAFDSNGSPYIPSHPIR